MVLWSPWSFRSPHGHPGPLGHPAPGPLGHPAPGLLGHPGPLGHSSHLDHPGSSFQEAEEAEEARLASTEPTTTSKGPTTTLEDATTTEPVCIIVSMPFWPSWFLEIASLAPTACAYNRHY